MGMGFFKLSKKKQLALTPEEFIESFNTGTNRTEFSRKAPGSYMGYGSPLLVRRLVRSIADVERSLDKMAYRGFGI